MEVSLDVGAWGLIFNLSLLSLTFLFCVRERMYVYESVLLIHSHEENSI